MYTKDQISYILNFKSTVHFIFKNNAFYKKVCVSRSALFNGIAEGHLKLNVIYFIDLPTSVVKRDRELRNCTSFSQLDRDLARLLHRRVIGRWV